MKRFLNLVLVFLMFSFTINTANSATTKFMVLSDIHISSSKSDAGARQLSKSITNLQKAVKLINESNVDFVVFAGDNIDRANKETLVMFSKIIDKVNKPTYAIIGNHDVVEIMGLDKKEYFRLLNKFSHNKISKVPTAKRMAPGLVFVFMDGVNQFIPGSVGNYTDKELLWLDRQLKKYRHEKVVIVQHYPIVEPRESKSHRTYRVEEYFKVLNKHTNVIAIISGHYHCENTTEKDGILHISVPSLVENNAFREVDIDHFFGGKYSIKTKTYEVN